MSDVSTILMLPDLIVGSKQLNRPIDARDAYDRSMHSTFILVIKQIVMQRPWGELHPFLVGVHTIIFDLFQTRECWAIDPPEVPDSDNEYQSGLFVESIHSCTGKGVKKKGGGIFNKKFEFSNYNHEKPWGLKQWGGSFPWAQSFPPTGSANQQPITQHKSGSSSV